MSGVYWGLTAMFLMNKQDMMGKEEIIEFVKSCQHDNGGFSASYNHDPHLLYTLSAIQVQMCILKCHLFLQYTMVDSLYLDLVRETKNCWG